MDSYLIGQTPLSDGGSPITDYILYRGTTSGTETFYQEGYFAPTYLFYNNTSVIVGDQYFYTIAAINNVGTGPQSSEVNGTVVSVPSDPLNFLATPAINKISLSWDPPASFGALNLTGYWIYKGFSAGTVNWIINAGNVTSYDDSAVAIGQQYYYQIVAYNFLGNGTASSQVSAIPITIPSKPLSLRSTPSNNGTNLTWTDPTFDGRSPIINFAIYRGTTSGGEVWIANTTGTETSYNDTTPVAGTYYYYVIAVNAIGNSSASGEVSSMPITAPSAPINLMITQGIDSLYLNWTTPASNGVFAITGYELYRSNTAGTETAYKAVGTLFYNDTGLTVGDDYFYYVTAINGIGTSPFSNEVNDMAINFTSVPLNLQAYSYVNGVNLTWTPPTSNGFSPITGYEIFRGTTSGSETSFAFIENTTMFFDTQIEIGQRYFYTVAGNQCSGIRPCFK